MLTTRVRTPVVCSTLAVVEASSSPTTPPGPQPATVTTRLRLLLIGAVLTAACGTSPSPPTAPSEPVRETSVVLGEGQTATPPGTDLRVSLLGNYVLGAAAIECMANASCNFSPSATLRVEVPGVAPETRMAHIPNPMGGEAFSYGGYVVRVTGFAPAWDEHAPLDASEYKVLLTVTGK